jgi:hypothetical protein
MVVDLLIYLRITMNIRQYETLGRLGPALKANPLKSNYMSSVKKMCLDPEQYINLLRALSRINVPWQHVEAAAAAKVALASIEEYEISVPDSVHETCDKKE